MPASPPSPDPRAFLPLSPQVFQILLSLADEPRHGYSIIADILARTGDEIRLTASTLYDALARLLDQALIEELDAPGRRRCYRLTALGRDTAREEARRLERLIASARDRHLLPDARGRGRR